MKKILFLFIFLLSIVGYAQVTNSSISGTVKSSTGERLPGATVEALHKPTGSRYFATTDGQGGYAIPSIRPGGPYTVKVTYIGYKISEITEINAPLGNNIPVNVVLESEVNALQEVVVKTSTSNSLFSKGKTGASTQFSERQITAVPVLGSRSISSVTKYSPYAGANGSFGGQAQGQITLQ